MSATIAVRWLWMTPFIAWLIFWVDPRVPYCMKRIARFDEQVWVSGD